MPTSPERSVPVSTLELFFDLVFVFTITQLTGVLVDGGDPAAFVQVVVMLLLIWWTYDAYAWLTNAIATDRPKFRLLLIGGMAGFLVIALAVPDAYDGGGWRSDSATSSSCRSTRACLSAGRRLRGTRNPPHPAVQLRGRFARARRRRARR